MRSIYLDYAATTPVDERVVTEMVKYLDVNGDFGNPASRSHFYGWMAEEAVEEARNQVADLIGADSREIVWTSGATESNNLAIKGVAENYAPSDCHIITSATEHKAVLDPVVHLQQQGYEVSIIQPDSTGVISKAAVEAELRPNTRLVSVMAVNNETGVINPIDEIAGLCEQVGVYFHVDAAQAIGKVSLSVETLPVTMLSMSGHKFYGPKGVGALYVRRRSTLKLLPQMHGGGHERGMRSGTLPTHQLVGIGKAAQILSDEAGTEIEKLQKLRDQLWQGISSSLADVSVNGSQAPRSPAHLNVCFHGVDGESLLMGLRMLAVSSGSACMSATVAPSYVLKAMGLSDHDAHSSIRFSVGRYTTEEDIDNAVSAITEAVTSLRTVAKS
ncbi:IscS subfamily cysteine desulfurase [Reinekea marinisedimentorum]|uniref:cysteine desulfurase n=1 Tax=Reinekea marinisedimentorum TaxID=230495 RepID=A0A4R3I9G5_9GAMM|nr:IscS subfamily cysteine desulfurase [Reinekea marinisedimentorum]TCS42020.1 cysteine desulfurase [Reinekea marinisedimentorum]